MTVFLLTENVRVAIAEAAYHLAAHGTKTHNERGHKGHWATCKHTVCATGRVYVHNLRHVFDAAERGRFVPCSLNSEGEGCFDQ